MRAIDPLPVLATALVALSLCAGCASLPRGSVRDPRDHFERFNRTMFKFNSTLDRAVMRPIARTYVKITSTSVRAGLSNFLANLAYTRTMANDVLQGRPKDFSRDLARLLVNTTVGLAGFLDPASRVGLLRHDRDCGQTFGKWGIPTGSYLVLPFIGPSDVRDAMGTVVDRFMTVDGYVDDAAVSYGLFGSRTLDGRANSLSTDTTVESAYDPYAFVRSAWFQQRAYKVQGGKFEDLPPLPSLGPDTSN